MSNRNATTLEAIKISMEKEVTEVTTSRINGPTPEGVKMKYVNPVDRMTAMIIAMTGLAPDPSLEEDRNHEPSTIEIVHNQVMWHAIESPMQGTDEVACEIVCGKVEPMSTMQDHIENRSCLAAVIAERNVGMIKRFHSFSMVFASEKIKNIVMNDSTLGNKFARLVETLGMTYIGGTSLNKGTFYGIELEDGHILTFAKAHEAIGYLSLLATPLKYVIDRKDLRILVVKNSEFRKTGLKENDGNILGGHTVGQVRVLIGGSSVAKGVMMSYDYARNTLKCDIPDAWYSYDMVVGLGDVKINPQEDMFDYGNVIGITEDNVWNIHGQSVAYGFEPLQFLAYDEGFTRLLNNRLNVNALPSYEDMILGAENRRRFLAACNGEEYEALELSSKVQEGLAAFGAEYPWVAQKVGGVVVNHVMNRSMKETAYRIGVVVTDAHAKKIGALRLPKEGEDATLVMFKFPVVAGVAQVVGQAFFGPFTVTGESLAKALNTDSDGDGVVTQEGPLAEYMIASGIIDALVDIKIPELTTRKAPATLENMSRQAVHIWTSSALIGSYTMLLYRIKIYNQMIGANLVPVVRLDDSLVYELIELVIKGAKKATEVVLAEKRTAMSKVYTPALKKMLVDAIPMPWSKRLKKEMMGKFNDATVEYDVKDMQTETTTVMHYMDFIWNSNIKRAKVELDKIAANVKPLKTFARDIPLYTHDGGAVERKELQSLRTSWGELRPASSGRSAGLAVDHASTVLAGVSVVSKTHSIEARAAISQHYLENVSGGNGGFIIHMNHGSLVELTKNVDTIMKDNRRRMVRIFTTDLDKGDSLNWEDMDYIHLTDGVFSMPNGEFGDVSFELADDYEAPMGEVIEDIMPMMTYKRGKAGVPGGTVMTKSAWVVLGSSDS